MNTALFLQVADAIEASPEHFNLATWFYAPTKSFGDAKTGWWFVQLNNECGTTACIAGWANAVTRGVNAADVQRAAKVLGLPQTSATVDRLFYAGRDSIWVDVAGEYDWDVDNVGDLENWSDVKAHQAADVLRRIARGELTL